MALPPLATPDDLSIWMGVTITNEDRAEAILAAASTLVRTFTGRTWVDADGEVQGEATDLQLDTVRTVVTLVAERVWTNPRGVRQHSEGPFSESIAEWSAYGLSLTDNEKEMLGVPSGGGVPGLGSVRLMAPVLAAGVPRSTWDLDDDEDDGS